jgi:hypothetical protein
MSVFHATRDRPRGPSDRTKAWAEFIESHADWFIGARKRWHEGDPPIRTHRLRMFGSSAGLLAAALTIVHLAS